MSKAVGAYPRLPKFDLWCMCCGNTRRTPSLDLKELLFDNLSPTLVELG